MGCRSRGLLRRQRPAGLFVWCFLGCDFCFSNSFIEIEFTCRTIHTLKMYDSMVFSMFRVVQPSPLVPGHVQPPEKKPRLFWLPLPIPLPLPKPGQPRIYFPSVGTCLFWIFYMKGILRYMVFCDWLLSLSTMCSRFIHVVACVSALIHFYGQIIFHCMTTPQFVFH